MPRILKGDDAYLRRAWQALFDGAPRPFDLLLSIGYIILVMLWIGR